MKDCFVPSHAWQYLLCICTISCIAFLEHPVSAGCSATRKLLICTEGVPRSTSSSGGVEIRQICPASGTHWFEPPRLPAPDLLKCPWAGHWNSASSGSSPTDLWPPRIGREAGELKEKSPSGTSNVWHYPAPLSESPLQSAACLPPQKPPPLLGPPGELLGELPEGQTLLARRPRSTMWCSGSEWWTFGRTASPRGPSGRSWGCPSPRCTAS